MSISYNHKMLWLGLTYMVLSAMVNNQLLEVIHLLSGFIIKETIDTKFGVVTLAKEKLKADYFNTYIPIFKFEKTNLREIKNILDSYSAKGVDLAMYFQQTAASGYFQYIANQGKEFDTESLMKVSVSKLKSNLQLAQQQISLSLINKNNLTAAVSIAKTCFPNYDNNAEYLTGIVMGENGLTEVQTYDTIIKLGDKPAGIGSVLYSKQKKSAYFHNMAVLPEFRRQGIYTSHVRLLAEYLIEQGVKSCYGITEVNSASNKANKQQGWEEVDRLVYAGTV